MGLLVKIKGEAYFTNNWMNREDFVELTREDILDVFAEDPVTFFEEFTEATSWRWNDIFRRIVESVEWVD